MRFKQIHAHVNRRCRSCSLGLSLALAHSVLELAEIFASCEPQMFRDIEDRCTAMGKLPSTMLAGISPFWFLSPSLSLSLPSLRRKLLFRFANLSVGL